MLNKIEMEKIIKIFLDDIRVPKDCTHYMHTRIGKDNLLYLEDDWIIVRSLFEFSEALEKYLEKIKIISLDYDLYEYEKYNDNNGADCAMMMLAYYEKYNDNNIEFPKVFVHSQNPQGRVLFELILENKEIFKGII
jgi:hypothetical protein